MKSDTDFDRRLRRELREVLDRELGPHPEWAESPAAQRVVAWERRSRRSWPLRMLAVAALIGVAGGAALFGGVPEPSPEVSRVNDAANGWIAFTVEEDGDLDIWLVALDRDARRVVGTDTDRIDDLCPAFSPDGRSLAYGRSEGDGSALVVADVDASGTVTERQTIEVGDGLPPPCPVWSPMGLEVAFGVPRTSPINAQRSAEGSEVWIVTLSDARTIVLPDLLATDLEWSPDGSLLAVASGRDEVTGGVLGDGRIHLYSPSSGTLRSLDPTLGARDLTWSPDGRSLAFTSGDSGGDGGLRVIDVESEELTILTAPFGVLHGIGPVWSPDGESIAFQRGCAGCGERSSIIQVFVEDLSGAAGSGREVEVPMVRPGTAAWGAWLAPYRVTWSPDGEYLLSMAWGAAGPGILLALPTDPDEAAVVLFDPANTTHIVPYDGYDETTLVPIQTWARRPSD